MWLNEIFHVKIVCRVYSYCANESGVVLKQSGCKNETGESTDCPSKADEICHVMASCHESKIVFKSYCENPRREGNFVTHEIFYA